MLLDLLSAGMTNAEILEDYPAARGLPHRAVESEII
jgi:uncharacterized protein (DUF433 family)